MGEAQPRGRPSPSPCILPVVCVRESYPRAFARLCPLICALLAVLCYANTLGNDFCDDDLPIIVQNPLVTQPGQWGALWLQDYWHADPLATPYRDLLYRPLAVLSYRLNHAIGGLNPSPYHAVNIVLHALVTVLVYRLTCRLTGSLTAALVAGSIFAVLPIHTEAVNNVVGRAELLAAAFTLLALELFARPRRPLTVAGGALCVLAACCSKESGVVVLPLVPLLAWYQHVTRWGGRPAPGRPDASGLAARWIPAGASLVLAAVVYLVLRFVALGGALYQPVTLTKTINVLADAPTWERVCGAFQLWGLYWAKTLWPQVLCLDYSILAVSPAGSLLKGHALIGLVVFALLLAWSVTKWRRGERLPAVLTVALLLSYLPVSNTVLLIKTYFAERVWYLPSIWVAVIVGQWAGALTQRAVARAVGRPSAMRTAIGALAALAVVAGLARSWIRNTEWRNEGTLYASAYRDHPNAIRSVLLYGDWLTRNGRYQDGIALMRRSIQIDLGFTDAHRMLGAAYLRAGDADMAFQHLQIADVQIPGHPRTQRLLDNARRAVAAPARGALTEAREAVARNPDDLDALIRLADELTGVGELDAAVTQLAQVQTRFADVSAFHHRLAVALVMANRRDEGIASYRRALDLEPDNADLLVELAMLLLDRRADGDLPEARTLGERAFRLAPTDLKARLCRAELLALDNRRAEAAAMFRAIAADLPEESELKRTCQLRAEWLER